MRSSPLAGVRLLLVDDDELVRAALRDFFVECGAHVVAADSARAGFAAFTTSPPDVLVSDLRVPPGAYGFWLIFAVLSLQPMLVRQGVAAAGYGTGSTGAEPEVVG